MSLFDTLKNLVDKDAQLFPPRRIDPAHVDHPFDVVPIKAERDYFRLWLSEMFLKKEVALFQQWYPAVQSLVRFTFGDQTIEVPGLADPTRDLGLPQPTPKGDIIYSGKALTPLMPFNGGTVTLSAGLVALKGDKNYLKRFVKVVTDFGKLAAVPQLSAALSVMEPLAGSVQELFDASNAGLHLGWYADRVGAGGPGGKELVPGYLAIIRAPAGPPVPRRLWVTDGYLYESDGAPTDTSSLFQGCDHMLLQIEIRSERDDYNSLSSFQTPWKNATSALEYGSMEEAETFYRMALGAIDKSPDLTVADRARMKTAFKTEYKTQKEEAQKSGLVAGEHRTLQELMDHSMTPDQALERGEPSLEELLAE